jgi:hypothetical protein
LTGSSTGPSTNSDPSSSFNIKENSSSNINNVIGGSTVSGNTDNTSSNHLNLNLSKEN